MFSNGDEEKMVEIDREDEDGLVAECTVCGGDIFIDRDSEEEDVVYCNDCEAEFLIRSLEPLRLTLLDDDIDEEVDGKDDYDEEFD